MHGTSKRHTEKSMIDYYTSNSTSCRRDVLFRNFDNYSRSSEHNSLAFCRLLVSTQKNYHAKNNMQCYFTWNTYCNTRRFWWRTRNKHNRLRSSFSRRRKKIISWIVAGRWGPDVWLLITNYVGYGLACIWFYDRRGLQYLLVRIETLCGWSTEKAPAPSSQSQPADSTGKQSLPSIGEVRGQKNYC